MKQLTINQYINSKLKIRLTPKISELAGPPSENIGVGSIFQRDY